MIFKDRNEVVKDLARAYDLAVWSLWSMPAVDCPIVYPDCLSLTRLLEAGKHESDNSLDPLRRWVGAESEPRPFFSTLRWEPRDYIYFVDHPRGEPWDKRRYPHIRAVADLVGARRFPEGFDNIWEAADELRKCRGVLTTDGGLAHISAAMGVPTMTLFGPTSLVKNAPIGERTATMVGSALCSPCVGTWLWNSCKSNDCMKGILPQESAKTFMEFLDGI